MNFSKRNVQTTAYPTFTTTRRTNPNFSMNTGCCIKSRNPLIGWRKEKTCCEPCFCTQIIRETTTLGYSIALGDSVTGNASGATGIIMGITGSSPDRRFTIHLDDCSDPFDASDNPTGAGGTGAGITIGTTNLFSGYEIGTASKAPCYSQNTAGWQEVFKNVNGPDCCLPRNRSIQNTARSSPEQTARNGGVPYKVSGKIDKSYNHNYRQYLRKRCKLAYYDQKGQSSFTFNNINNQNNIGQAACCGTNCGQYSNIATYKRSNWGFRRQGAVTANGYIATRGFKTANLCCCPCMQVIIWDPGAVPPPAIGDRVTQTGGASGVIIAVSGTTTFIATIRLDDCNKPFTGGTLLNLFVNGTAQGTGGTWTAREKTTCEPKDYPGRGPPDYPQNPQDNPKNYNKKQY